MLRRQFTLALTAPLAAAFALSACDSADNQTAAGTGAPPAAADLKAGRDYRALTTPVASSAPAGQVEVIEFFGYWCPHCYAFEPAFSEWKSKAPASILVRRVPVAFDQRQIPLQRLYYTLEDMGRIDALHQRIFEALHKHKQPLFSDEAVLAWASQQPELAGDEFVKAYRSFGLAAHLTKASQLMEGYSVDGVPSLGIGGKYYVDGPMAGSMDRVLHIATALATQTAATTAPAASAS